MLRALLDAGVRPDLVVGTSVGAINGAVLAARPAAEVADRLVEPVALAGTPRGRYAAGPFRRASCPAPAPTCTRPSRCVAARRAARRRHLRGPAGAFQCCAASIEHAAEHWFDERTGRRRRPRLRRGARAAAPGRIDDEHYLDGGIVNCIPLGRAVELGAHAGLRAAGRAHRAAARRAAQPVGGRPVVASRSPAGTASPATWPPLPDDVECTSSRPAAAPPRGDTGRRCATATSRPSAAGSSARTGRRPPTWQVASL